MENTRTIPSIVTLTTRSPSSSRLLPMICTPMFTVVCCPKRTILVPARQSQHTSALSAPAETRFLDDSATARIPFKWPASCWSGVKVSEEKRCTRLEKYVSTDEPPRRYAAYPTSWKPTTKTSAMDLITSTQADAEYDRATHPPPLGNRHN